jgi:hypothetical protein
LPGGLTSALNSYSPFLRGWGFIKTNILQIPKQPLRL